MKKFKNNVGAGASVRPTSKARQNKGITLIALVITIVVMLILVAVTITMAVNGGLFDYAGKATGETKNAINAEQELANLESNLTVNELIDKYTEGEKKEYIGTEKSYVGSYADFEGDGTIDGIIYADLAKGVSGTYYSTSYSKEAVTSGLKEYYVSKTDYEGTFGKDGTEVRDVITVVPNTTGVNDRFYVMALTDVTTNDYTTFYWYKNAYGNMTASDTAVEFGTGKANTEKIKGYWDLNASTPYGTQDPRDMWAQIDSDSNRTWFVPSKGEWAAFADAFDITASNYSSTYGLSGYYWSSSQVNTDCSWSVLNILGTFHYESVNLCRYGYVRMGATF